MHDRDMRALHVHLDPLGGVAGDMFIAAVLDARPDLESVLRDAVHACDLPQGWRTVHARRRTKGLDARTFDVQAPDGPTRASGRYAQLMERIDAMPLSAAVRERARDIYTHLGECEALVHGIALADVHFHELADWDSVVDIVGSAALIDALGAHRWSASPLPLGSGRVRTAHGPLPVPAPATARLLEGVAVVQDGIEGERVTPTGAAIFRHLGIDGSGLPRGRYGAGVTGLGAGQKEFEGCANVLRVQLFEAVAPGVQGPSAEQIAVIEFEVDDQSPEDLATGLERVRAGVGVLDVFCHTGTGKKQRISMAVRVLCEIGAVQRTTQACLLQTTTLGVRVSHVDRVILERSEHAVPTGAGVVRVKTAARPDNALGGKAEHDDVAGAATRLERERLGAEAVAAALAGHDAATPDAGPR